MPTALMNFDLPKEKSEIIKIIGVGGGGNNAVNYMFQQNVEGVNFMICNTDQQALEQSPIPLKIQLGVKQTEGLGAGSNPEVGRQAATESIDHIKEILSKNTKMAFITAGMGGGTGTGAAPIIAQVAREMGILTVGIVTLPFNFEGKMRKKQAEKGIEDLKKSVDTLLVICNDRLREMYGNLSLSHAFSKADDVLATAARGIAEIVTKPGFINVDFNDVKTVMESGGAAIMGYATGTGENRAKQAVETALASPLLNDNSIAGAKKILVNISCGKGEHEATLDEITEVVDYVYEEAGDPETLIHGVVYDESLEDKISVIVIATNLSENPIDLNIPMQEKDTKKHTLTEPNKDKIYYDEKPGYELSKDTMFTVTTKQTEKEEDRDVIKEEPKNRLKIGKTIIFNDNDPANKTQSVVKKGFVLETENKEQNTVPERKISTEDLRTERERPILEEKRRQELKGLNTWYRDNDDDTVKQYENEPAYKRKKVQFDDTAHSSEKEVSRYTLSMDDDYGKLSDRNSFLEDNVD